APARPPWNVSKPSCQSLPLTCYGQRLASFLSARTPPLTMVRGATEGLEIKLCGEWRGRSCLRDDGKQDESGVNRKNIQDSRVHCCLLRPLDVAFLRAVHEKVNIVPVIGKADALTPEETQALKQKIRDQLQEEEINIYQFPECDSDEDEDFKRQDAEMKNSIPFAVVGSCEVVRDGGTRPVRGRRYSWGTVEVENPHHCDFLNLRRMLVQTHLQDLKEVTHDLLYEGYRARCLQSLARPGARASRRSPPLGLDTPDSHSATEIPLPMLPLAETEKLIREKDEELRRMQEMLEKMQAQMQQSQAQGEQSDAL
uniref:Septin 1 n=1 Tax=Oryctolagus cuniculus TaxID=9986 RepID=G1TRW4_RABIT